MSHEYLSHNAIQYQRIVLRIPMLSCTNVHAMNPFCPADEQPATRESLDIAGIALQSKQKIKICQNRLFFFKFPFKIFIINDQLKVLHRPNRTTSQRLQKVPSSPAHRQQFHMLFAYQFQSIRIDRPIHVIEHHFVAFYRTANHSHDIRWPNQKHTSKTDFGHLDRVWFYQTEC